VNQLIDQIEALLSDKQLQYPEQSRFNATQRGQAIINQEDTQ